MKNVWHCFECKKFFNREPYIGHTGLLYCPFCSSKNIERIPDKKKEDDSK